MRLTADRFIVAAGERVRAVVVVTVNEIVIAAEGGLAHLRHALEDIGFRDVEIFTEAPDDWEPIARIRPVTGDLEWVAWFEATSLRSASYVRELTDELRIVAAWTAPDEVRGPDAYAITPARPMRLVGFVTVFGEAYPLFALEAA